MFRGDCGLHEHQRPCGEPSSRDLRDRGSRTPARVATASHVAITPPRSSCGTRAAAAARAAGPLKDVTVGADSRLTQLSTVLAVAFPLVLHGREYSERAALVGRCHDRLDRVHYRVAAVRGLHAAPLVYGRAVNVNPLVTIISLLLGAELLGILGVRLAIPSAAAIQIILRE